MSQITTGATTVMPLSSALAGGVHDANGKPVKFKQQKDDNNPDTPPTFIGNGTDGKVYTFTMEDAPVAIQSSAKVDMKELRRRGHPVPKDQAEKLDEEIKKENEERDKSLGIRQLPATTDTEKTAEEQQRQQQQQQQEGLRSTAQQEEEEEAKRRRGRR